MPKQATCQMRRTGWIYSFIFICGLGGYSSSAAEPVSEDPPQPSTAVIQGDPLPQTTLTPNEIKTFPLDRNRVVRRVIVGGGSGSTAGATNKLVYSNTLGMIVAQIPEFGSIADDLVLLTLGNCVLDRYTFQVTDKADPSGVGGTYNLFYELFESCPSSGGKVIAGTDGVIEFSDEQIGDIQQIEVVIPDDQIVMLGTSVWLRLRTSRENVGLVMGAPALKGFSEDFFDFPGFACNASIGGFPAFGHASFNAEVYVRGECPDAFPAYRNVQDARGGMNRGTNVWLADDLELMVDSCEMVGYEVGVRGAGFYTFEMLRDADGTPGETITGTRTIVINSESTFKKESFAFDPPITIDKNVWLAARVGNTYGGWVLTQKDASLGRTATTFTKKNSLGQWETQEPRIGQHGGFYVNIICAGQPPVGACCDMFMPDENGESICREVPEMNCFQSLKNPDFQPSWMEGEACDSDPFPYTCGAAACCKPFGADEPSCENLTRNECDDVEPTSLRRLWEMGRYCDENDQQCPAFSVCIERSGYCTSEHSTPGCQRPFCCLDVCEADRYCCFVEWDELCVKAAQELCHMPPGNDECSLINYSTGAKSIAVGGSSNTYLSNASTDPTDPGICCHGGEPKRCVGSLNEGSLCDDNSDCPDGICQSTLSTPGQQGLKTVWYQFEIPQRNNPEESEFVSVELNTCDSETISQDTMLQVFQSSVQESGFCENIRTCQDGTPCEVSGTRCKDGQGCRYDRFPCSVSNQDCPDGSTCLLDLNSACSQLSVIGCNDDAGDACAPLSGKHSKVCLTDLRRGETYFVMVATKVVEDTGNYTLEINEVDSCHSESFTNNHCENALEVIDGITPFDLSEASFTCPVEECLPSMVNDIWFKYIAPQTGHATIETCGPDRDSTPDTEMVIYHSCDCPPQEPITCSGRSHYDCFYGSTASFNITKDQCYMIRVADYRGGGGFGNLTVHSAPPCPDVIPDWIDPLPFTNDARRPHPADHAEKLEGISTLVVKLPVATDEHCWKMIEMRMNSALLPPIHPSLIENTIVDVEIQQKPLDQQSTLNILHLNRPIIPGGFTTIQYDWDLGQLTSLTQALTVASLPGDVDDNKTVCTMDVLELINILKGDKQPKWGMYSADIDHSGSIHPADLLQLIDLMNGAGAYEPWLGASLDLTTPNCP